MKKIFIILILIFAAFSLFCIEKIEAAFVSKISIEVANGKVLIQWQNPLDFDQNITIYRSDKIIDSNEKLQSTEKIITLIKQEEQYIDIPGDSGDFYYAVLITDKSSNVDSKILVPYRNYTLKPATIKKDEFFEITKIAVKPTKNNIKISWNYKTNSSSSKKIMLYRNTSPILDEKTLSSSIKIATYDIEEKLYIDVPITNIKYYYAIFIENEKEKKYQPNINVSIDPVSITSENINFGDFSIDNFIPLPLLTLKKDPKTGKLFLDPQILKNPVKIKYNNKTKKIIEEYKEKYKDIYSGYIKDEQKKLEHLNFHILNDEEIYTTEEYFTEYSGAVKLLKEKNYDGAKAIFDELIKEILPEELLVRISYYLGQIYYNEGNFYMSYIYLIYSYDSYRKEVFPYLNSIYYNIFAKLER